MPARSKVDSLPRDGKTLVEEMLVKNNFGGYEALEAALRAHGYSISKSSLQRYGQKFEQRLGALKRSTEMAQAVVKATGDESGARNDANIQLLQELFFAITSDPDRKLTIKELTELSHAMASVTRASVQQKTWAARVRKEDAAKLAKLEAEARSKSGKKGGLDAETLRRVREEIYGF